MRNQFLTTIIVISLTSTAAVLTPISGYGEDLVAAYKLAVDSDPELKRARAAMLDAMEAKPQSRARFLPSLNGGADYTYQHRDQNFAPDSGIPDSSKSFGSYGYSLNLSQPIYHYDAFVQSRQADSQVAQAQVNFVAAQQDLILRVSASYFEVMAAQDNLTFARAEKEAIERQLEQTKQRFNVGLIAITDVHEAQARYDLSVTTEIDAENRLDNAYEALREVTGRYIKDLAKLQDNSPLVAPQPSDIEKWVKTALEQNMQLLSSQFNVDIANEQINRQRSQRYPNVDLVGSYGYSDQSDAGPFSPETVTNMAVGVQLNWNFYQGGLIGSTVRQAAYRLTQAKESLESQRRTTVRQTRDTYLGTLAGISRVKALNQAVISQKSALDATEAGLEVGTRTTVDVLNARTGLFGARRDYAQSRYDYILNTLRLKQAAGTLAEQDLSMINKWLQ
jgi:outer membrane protein